MLEQEEMTKARRDQMSKKQQQKEELDRMIDNKKNKIETVKKEQI